MFVFPSVIQVKFVLMNVADAPSVIQKILVVEERFVAVVNAFVHQTNHIPTKMEFAQIVLLTLIVLHVINVLRKDVSLLFVLLVFAILKQEIVLNAYQELIVINQTNVVLMAKNVFAVLVS